MKVFTLWNQNPIPEERQACIDSWGERLEVIRGDSGDMLPMLWADHERFRLLADQTFYPDDDVLYVDADTMPATGFDEAIASLDRTRPAFSAVKHARYDIWACLRWRGEFDLFNRLYLKHCNDEHVFGYKRDLDTIEGVNIQRISGYPHYKVIIHKNFSAKG